MTDYEEKKKEYRNRAIQALGTAIVLTLIVVANVVLIACIGRLSVQETKYLLYAQCGLVDLLGSVGMVHCYHYFDKWKGDVTYGYSKKQRRQTNSDSPVNAENQGK